MSNTITNVSISQALNSYPQPSDLIPIARPGDTTARNVTVGDLRSGGLNGITLPHRTSFGLNTPNTIATSGPGVNATDNTWIGSSVGAASQNYGMYQNVGVGGRVMQYATIGSSNVFIGYKIASYATNAGYGMIGIGSKALEQLTGGERSIVIGHNAGNGGGVLNNSLLIGADVAGPGATVTGYINIMNEILGNVGYGLTIPNSLSVGGTISSPNDVAIAAAQNKGVRLVGGGDVQGATGARHLLNPAITYAGGVSGLYGGNAAPAGGNGGDNLVISGIGYGAGFKSGDVVLAAAAPSNGASPGSVFAFPSLNVNPASGTAAAGFVNAQGFMVNGVALSPLIGYTNVTITSLGHNASTINQAAVVVGQNAGQYTTNASSSILIGFNAGQHATYDPNSVAIGNQAGRYANNSTYSVMVGDQAGGFASGSPGAIFIGNRAGIDSYNAANAIIIGNGITAFRAPANYINIGNVLKGVQGTSATISPSLNVGAATGSTPAGFVNAEGFAVNGVTIPSVVGVTNGTSTSIGVDAGTAVPYGVTMGYGAGGYATSAQFGVFIGPNAGKHATLSSFALMVGSTTGQYASSASGSVMLGNYAGFGAAYAASSVIIGSNAGSSASGASQGVMIGMNAGSGAALAANSVMIGVNAGEFAANANNAVMIGNGAGSYATTASNSVMIGYNVAGNAATPPNYLNIGNHIKGVLNASSTITAPLTIDGPIAPTPPRVVSTATDSVLLTDSTLIFTFAGTTTETLPSAETVPGQLLNFKLGTASGITTVASAGTDVVPVNSTIPGNTILAAPQSFAVLQSDGTYWQIIQQG